jgi:uncharacterized damage-inducible protein DinB
VNSPSLQSDLLLRIVEGVPREALDRPRADGSWTAREHFAHLARYHEVFLERVERMRTEDRPRFTRYRAEDDPEFAAWRPLPVDELIARLLPLRRRVIDSIASLGDAGLARTGVHSAFGEMPVSMWLEFFLAHEGHHIYEIFKRART